MGQVFVRINASKDGYFYLGEADCFELSNKANQYNPDTGNSESYLGLYAHVKRNGEHLVGLYSANDFAAACDLTQKIEQALTGDTIILEAIKYWEIPEIIRSQGLQPYRREVCSAECLSPEPQPRRGGILFWRKRD